MVRQASYPSIWNGHKQLLASTHLIRLQYKSELVKLNGGIRINHEDARIRLDNVQHAVDAFDKIIEVFRK